MKRARETLIGQGYLFCDKALFCKTGNDKALLNHFLLIGLYIKAPLLCYNYAAKFCKFLLAFLSSQGTVANL